MRGGSNFIFESVDLLHYLLHKISVKRGNSYIKSPNWLINKITTINPQNNDDQCFLNAITVALNHQNIRNNPERISKIKPVINQYNWIDINIKEDREKLEKTNMTTNWKNFEQNNKTIALNILFLPYNTKTIRLAYKSKYNCERENQVVLLMITDGKKWHYLALKSVRTTNGYNRPVINLSIFIRGITSNNDGDFYCSGCLHSFHTDNALKKH